MRSVRSVTLLSLVLAASAQSLQLEQQQQQQRRTDIVGGALGAVASAAADLGATAGAGVSASAGLSLVTGALTGCQAQVNTCNSAILDLSADVDVSVTASAIVGLAATLEAALTTCQGAGTITLTEFIGLYADISGLAGVCATLFANLSAKKDVIVGLDGCDFIGNAILDIQVSAGALFQAIVGLTLDLDVGVDIGGIFGLGASVDLSAITNLSVKAVLELIAGK